MESMEFIIKLICIFGHPSLAQLSWFAASSAAFQRSTLLRSKRFFANLHKFQKSFEIQMLIVAIKRNFNLIATHLAPRPTKFMNRGNLFSSTLHRASYMGESSHNCEEKMENIFKKYSVSSYSFVFFLVFHEIFSFQTVLDISVQIKRLIIFKMLSFSNIIFNYTLLRSNKINYYYI